MPILFLAALLFLQFNMTIKAQSITTTITTTGSGTWIAPGGVSSVTIEGWGAGGSGGSPSYTYSVSSSGGGGSYIKSMVSVTPGTVYNYSVGAGGAAVRSGNGNPGGATYFGNTGTGSTIGSLLLASGGVGGVRPSSNTGGTSTSYLGGATGGIGGQSASNIPLSGNIYNISGFSAIQSVGGSSTILTTGAGGKSAFGGAGGTAITAPGSGNPGSAPGGGGSGVISSGSATYTSGAGASGQMAITYVPVAPVITSISPASAAQGSSPITLTVIGSNFISGYSVITWNGAPLATTFSNGNLTATVSASLLSSISTATVGVKTTPTTGSPLVSNTQPFSIISVASPTQLAVVSVPSIAYAATPFSVTVQSQDATGTPQAVSAPTAINLSNTGGGSIGGNTSTITTYSSTLSTVTLSTAAAGVTLTASASGLTTSAASTPFTVYSAIPTTTATAVKVAPTSITSSSLSLSWTNGNGLGRIVVARPSSVAGIAPTVGTTYTPSTQGSYAGSPSTGGDNVVVYNGTGSSVTITNLTAYTSYVFDVYEYNGTGSVISYSASASSAATVTAITAPYVESFNSASSLPLGWTASAAAGTVFWAATAGDPTYGVSGPSSSNVPGSNFAYLFVRNTQVANNPYTLTSPLITIPTTGANISYQYFLGSGGYTSAPVPLTVQVSTDYGVTFNTVYSHTTDNSTFATSNSPSNWQTATFDLNAYAGQTIMIQYSSNGNRGTVAPVDQALDEISLNLDTVPSAPTIINTHADNGYVEVYFTPPTSNGDATITNYKYSLDSGATFIAFSPAQTTSPLTITGLTNGTTYNIMIEATNLVGDGPPSNDSTVVPAVPLAPPTLSVQGATVDNPFEVTYASNINWANAVTSIQFNGVILTGGYTVSAGKIVFDPSMSVPANVLQTAGGPYKVIVFANGYANNIFYQTINAGVAKSLYMSRQPVAPDVNGSTLATQPVVGFADQYNNPSISIAAVTAAVATGSGSWTLGGTTVVDGSTGDATFFDLTATSAAAVPAAQITFTSPGITKVTSNAFAIPPPPPVNAVCSGALNTLTQDGANNTLSMVSATTSPNMNGDYYLYYGALWYSITPQCSSNITITTSNQHGQAFNIFVFQGATCPANSQFDIADNVTGSVSTTSATVTFAATAGTTYLIRFCEALNATLTTFNVTVTPDVTPTVTLSATALPATGAIGLNKTKVPLFGFTTTPLAACSNFTYGINSVTINTSGTANTSDLSNFNVYVDVNGNGAFDDASDVIVSTAAQPLSSTMTFTLTGQTTLTSASTYFLVADVAAGATSGHTIQASISQTSNVSLTYSLSTASATGTATGNVLTISPAAPALVAATNATVDAPFVVTFNPSTAPTWSSSITAITIGGVTLTAGYTISSNSITFTPSASVPANLLQTSGLISIDVIATNFGNATKSQLLKPGVATQIGVLTQPVDPASNGGVLTTQPVAIFLDQYGNITTSTDRITAAPSDGSWTIGGTTSVNAVNGKATFTNLTATSPSGISTAAITFTGAGLTPVTSATFNIPDPPPSNDLCSNATTLLQTGVPQNATMVSATGTLPDDFIGYQGDVWFKFDATCSGSMDILTSNNNQYLDIYVFDGTTCPNDVNEALNFFQGDNNSTEYPASAFPMQAGHTYYIRVALNLGSTPATFTITATPTITAPLLTVTSDGTPVAGSLSPANTNVSMFGFTNTPNVSCTGVTYTFNSVTITTSGTATSADLSNFRLYSDANSNGVYDPADILVSTSAQPFSSSMTFTITGQSGLSSAGTYFLVGDVSSSPVNGHTFTASIAGPTDLVATFTQAGSVTGTAIGNVQTIITTPCTSPTAQPTALVITPLTSTSMSLSFTAASGSPSGYLIVRTTTSTPPTSPTNGVSYIVATSSLGSNSYIVYSGASTAISVASLSPNTRYWYWIYTYNNTACAYGPDYYTVSPLTGDSYTYSSTGNLANWITTSSYTPIVAAGVKAATFNNGAPSLGSSVAASGPTGSNGIYGRNFPTSSTKSATAYYQFSVTPNTNYAFKVSSVVFSGYYQSSTGNGSQMNMDIYYSTSSSFSNPVKLNNDTYFLTGAGVYGLTYDATNATIPPSVQSGSTLYFRIYGYNMPAAADYFGILNFQVNGSDGAYPVITSPLTASTTYGTAGSYTITTNASTFSYAATGIPTGITYNAQTGVISSAATTQAGAYPITISATNLYGTVNATLLYTVNRAALTIKADNKTVNNGDPAPTPYTYTITGFVNGETAAVLTGVPSVTSIYAPGIYSPTGVPIVPSIGTLSSTNYTFTYVDGYVFVPCVAGTWVGPNGGDANVAGNWCFAQLPTATSDINISASTPRLTTNLTVNNLTLNSGLNLNGFTFTCNAITGNGTFTASTPTSTLVLNSGTINFSKTKGQNYLGTLIVNGNITLGDTLNLTKLLTLNTGTLTTGGFLNLKSTSITNTAIVGPLGSGAAISGKVIVERFIPLSQRVFRDIAPAVNSGSSTIFSTWQESGKQPSGYGVYITGAAGSSYGWSSNGLDYSYSGNPSMYYYNNATWSAVTSTNKTTDTLSAYHGYRVLVRGDRTFNIFTTPQGGLNVAQNGPGPMQNPTALRSKGTLVTGTVTYTTAAPYNLSGTTGNYSFVGNPYQAPVNWNTLAKSNLATQFWYLDPTVGNGEKYVVYDAALGTNNNPVFADSSLVTGSYVSNVIQPGQAFFVKATGASPTLTFTEADKLVNAPLTGVFSTGSSVSKISVTLWHQNTSGVYRNMDGAVVAFGSAFSNAINNEDSKKLASSTDNLAFENSNNLLSIEARNIPTTSDSLFISTLDLSTADGYQLKVNTNDYISGGLQPYLYDAYLKKSTALQLGSVNTYGFTIDNNVAASFTNRFSIVFHKVVLPISSIKASATATAKGILVNWTINGVQGASDYKVESSTNGIDFKEIGSLPTTLGSEYTFMDANAVTGINYYRIKAIAVDGSVVYSAIVSATKAKIAASFAVYPNPVHGNKLNISFNNVDQGTYRIQIDNNLGQTVATKTVSITNATSLYSLELGNSMSAGVYHISILTADGNQESMVYKTSISKE